MALIDSQTIANDSEGFLIQDRSQCNNSINCKKARSKGKQKTKENNKSKIEIEKPAEEIFVDFFLYTNNFQRLS